MRIQTLQPMIKNGEIIFDKTHRRLLEQLKFFPLADHDDGPDALEGCVSLIKSKMKRKIVAIRGLRL